MTGADRDRAEYRVMRITRYEGEDKGLRDDDDMSQLIDRTIAPSLYPGTDPTYTAAIRAPRRTRRLKSLVPVAASMTIAPMLDDLQVRLLQDSPRVPHPQRAECAVAEPKHLADVSHSWGRNSRHVYTL